MSDLLVKAVRALAGVDDGAQSYDGMGYNKFDTDFGNRLARKPGPEWSVRERYAAWKMIHKYRGQLEQHGIDYFEIPEPDSPPPDKRITLEGGEFAIRFPYDKAMVDAVRSIPGRRYSDRVNYAPFDARAAAALRTFADTFEFHVSDEAMEKIADLIEEGGGNVPPARSVTLAEDGSIELRFPKDYEIIDAVRDNVPGARFDRSAICWRAPGTAYSARKVREIARRHDLHVSDEFMEAFERIESVETDLMTLSLAKSSDFDVEGLGMDLYPFQRAGVEYATKALKTFIADQMGLGKTAQAIATVFALECDRTVVVCPASLKLNWKREIERWIPGASVVVLDGRDAWPESEYEADFIVVNYDILRFTENPKEAKKEGRKAEPIGHLRRLLDSGYDALIMDESHYAKNAKAIRSQACLRLAKGVDVTLLLTGTPILNRPEEIVNQLKILGRLREFGGWRSFMRRYCGAYRGRWGWDTSGAQNLEELNERLRRSCYVRRTKDQVLKELPPKQRSTLPIEIDNRKEYRDAEADVARWFAEQAVEDAEFKDSLKEMDDAEKKAAKAARYADAAYKASKAEQLVRLTALKRIAARGKLSAAIEWISDFIESGEKLVVFGHHREVVDSIADHFQAPSITGDTKNEDRQAAVDRFQNDEDCRLIVGNLRAMGVGLTLTAASDVAFIELGWNPADHDQAEDRCHRIGQDDSVTAWYLTAPDTIEEDIVELIEEKRVVVDAATEGEAMEASDGIIGEISRRIMERNR